MGELRSDRRRFVRRLALGGLALLGARRLRAQEPAGAPAAEGGTSRLYDPAAVQRRTATTSADNDPFIVEVEKTLKCQCGCNLNVYTCRTTDFTCTVSPELHRDVIALRDRGMSADQIRADFVRQYGEQALMAPAPAGFNLAGYLMPGAMMLLGIGTLSFWILRRQREVAAAPAGPADSGGVATAAGVSPEELERLRQALSGVRD